MVRIIQSKRKNKKKNKNKKNYFQQILTKRSAEVHSTRNKIEEAEAEK